MRVARSCGSPRQHPADLRSALRLDSGGVPDHQLVGRSWVIGGRPASSSSSISAIRVPMVSEGWRIGRQLQIAGRGRRAVVEPDHRDVVGNRPSARADTSSAPRAIRSLAAKTASRSGWRSSNVRMAPVAPRPAEIPVGHRVVGQTRLGHHLPPAGEPVDRGRHVGRTGDRGDPAGAAPDQVARRLPRAVQVVDVHVGGAAQSRAAGRPPKTIRTAPFSSVRSWSLAWWETTSAPSTLPLRR